MPIEIQLTPLILLYVVSALLTLGLTGYALAQLRSKGWDATTVAFIGIVLGASIWSLSRTFELLFVSETLTRFWIGVLYIGYGTTTMSGLFFGLAFTGRKRLLTRRNVALILTLPAVAVFVAFTNDYVVLIGENPHQLFWTGEFETYDAITGEPYVYVREFQPLFHAYLLYTVGATLLGLYFLLQMAVTSPEVYRRQTAAFVVGTATALFFGIQFGFEMQPFVPQFIDLSPVGFTVMGLCFGYAIFRHRMLDLVPVARNTVVENMRDGYVVLDTDGRIVDFNDAAKELFETSDATGTTDTARMADPAGMPVDRALPACADVIAEHEHGTRAETEVTVDANGDQRFLVATVSSLSEGKTLIGRLLLLRDVTDHRAVQKRYQALIENSTDLILVTEPDGEIVYASPSIKNVTGVEPEQVVGENAFEFVYGDDRPEFKSAFERLVDNPGERYRQEFRTRDVAGNWLYLEASVWNLLDNPFVEGLVVNAREITDRKERERELEETNEQLTRANEQLEQFANVITHDLRNPLNVARGHLELARDGREESFTKIDESLLRMEAIIDDVLTLAREGEAIGETESVELEACAREAWDHVATDDATLTVAENATFETDPARILQLFENLFRNAHEHGGEDVTIRVGVENGTLYVEDDGPGIPEERHETVLEYGHTTNENGTGLGLSIVEAIADAHGWDVTVTDGTDGGARFEFTGVVTRPPQTSA